METWKNRDMIYDVVIGAVEEGNANPEVKTVFGEDSLCEKLYEEIYQTKEKLSQRLGKEGEEDADIEKIINNMFDICRIVGNMERWIPLNKLDALDEKSVEQG